MVHEDQFAPIGVSFFEWGKLPRFGAERLVGCGNNRSKKRKLETEHRDPCQRCCALSREATAATSCGRQPAEIENNES